MIEVLAIDPGPLRSAWVLWPVRFQAGLADNERVLDMLRSSSSSSKILVIEQVCSYGMPVGREVFDTVYWSGRFAEAWGGAVSLLPRLAVKQHICHDSRAKDSHIRQAMIDRFGSPGTKKQPGLLYGVKRDIWSALAVAVTYHDQHYAAQAASKEGA